MKKIKVNADLYVGNEKLATVKDVAAVKNGIKELQRTIVTDGDGSKFLSDDGAYKEITTTGTGVAIQGPKGDDGKSAYQIAVDEGYVGTESDWLASLKGDKGETGPQGPKGDKGADGTMSFTDLTEEQKESLRGPQGEQGPKGDKGDKGDTGEQGPQGPKGDKGDTGEQGPQGIQGPKGDKGADGTMTFADLTEEQKESLRGPQGIQGPKGDKGDTGEQGPQGLKGDKGNAGNDGKSAYQIAVDNGYVGTESAWVASLKGTKGDTGAQGPQGIQGEQGPKGDKGDAGNDGKSVYQIAVDNGYVGTEDEFNNALANIEESGSKYKPDGTTITADSDGTMHAHTDPEQIKQNVQDYMTEHPVSAEVGDKSVTEEKLSDDVLSAIKTKKIRYAKSVDDIKNLPLEENMVVRTLGFYGESDGGSAMYVIKKHQNSVNKLKFVNSLHTVVNTDGTTATIQTFENGDIVINGSSGTGINIAWKLLTTPAVLEKNKTYTFSSEYVSGEVVNYIKDLGIQLEDGLKKVVNVKREGTGKLSFTAADNYSISFVRFLIPTSSTYNNFTFHLQLEEGDNATPWKDRDYDVNGHTVISLSDEFDAVLVPVNNKISMTQMGWKPNDRYTDAHDSITQYIELCNKDNQKYELYINPGKWYFSETCLNNGKKGVWIVGASGQVSDRTNESIILPFENKQRFVWNVGYEDFKNEMVGGNILKNLVFSTNDSTLRFSEKPFCEGALTISFCCYSEFDGLYFHQCNGCGLILQKGWENNFGFLNFRGCGFWDKDRTYSAFEMRPHPRNLGGFPSAISANIFNYFNFEGVSGNGIYCEHNCCAVHNEVGDIQAEFTYYQEAFPDGYEETYNTEIKELDDTDPRIEHIYLIKGNHGGNYNPFIINSISISTQPDAARTLIWTDEEGYRQRRWKKLSGILGGFETGDSFMGRRDGLNVMVSNLSSLSSTVPVWHNVDDTPLQSAVRIANLHGLALPMKGKKVGNIVTIGNYKKQPINKDWIIYPTYQYCTSYGTFSYDKDCVGIYKMALMRGEICIPVSGKKIVRLHMKFDYNSIEEVPNSITSVMDIHLRDGKYLQSTLSFNKSDIVSGKYPINKLFYYELPASFLPYEDCMLYWSISQNTSKILLDTIEVSAAERKLRYADVKAVGGMKSTMPHTLAVIHDRKLSEESTVNGVLCEYDGTNWNALSTGTDISNLPKSKYIVNNKLTKCSINIPKDQKFEAGTEVKIVVTPNTDMCFTYFAITEGEKFTKLEDFIGKMGEVELNLTLNDNVYVDATAAPYKTIRYSIDHCVVNEKDIDTAFGFVGKSRTISIAPELGYNMDNITCTMGGVEQSIVRKTIRINGVDYPNGAEIKINSVSDDIVVTSTTSEKEHQQVTLNMNHVTCDYKLDYALLGQKLEMTFTPDAGFTLEPVDAKQKENPSSTKDAGINVVDGVATFWTVTGPVTVNAWASPNRNAISYNLTNCVSSETVVHRPTGTSYSTTITANDGYTLGNVTCTMGGTPVQVENGAINIDYVLGDIVITATATSA